MTDRAADFLNLPANERLRAVYAKRKMGIIDRWHAILDNPKAPMIAHEMAREALAKLQRADGRTPGEDDDAEF